MQQPNLNEGVTLSEYEEACEKIKKPFQVTEMAKKDDWGVQSGRFREGEILTSFTIPKTPKEAWEQMVSLDAKLRLLGLQFGLLQRYNGKYNIIAIEQEIKRIESFITEAKQKSIKDACNPQFYNYGPSYKDFRFHEYLRFLGEYYETHNCFEGNNYQLTYLIYADCFMWLPFLKSLIERGEKRGQKNETLGHNEPPPLSALDALLVYFREDKREIAKEKILPFLKENFSDLKGKPLAASWYGLYKSGFVNHPENVIVSHLHSALHNYLEGDNGTYGGFNNDGIKFYKGIENHSDIKIWRNRFQVILNDENTT